MPSTFDAPAFYAAIDAVRQQRGQTLYEEMERGQFLLPGAGKSEASR